MARLPKPGGDEGQWGDILNKFLSVAHADNGAIKHGTIVEQNLSSSLRQKLNQPSSSTQTRVINASSAYEASVGDFVICDASAAGFIVTLPPASQGARVSVKKTDASVNAIVVMRSGVPVDSDVSVAVNVQWQSQDFLADDNQWYKV